MKLAEFLFLTLNMKVKTRTSKNIIFKFSCSKCESMYVGSTSRTLGARIAEHVGRSYRTEKIVATPSHSSIRDHMFTCDTPVTISNFKIMSSATNNLDLRILESLYIFKHEPKLNHTKSAYPLKIIKL